MSKALENMPQKIAVRKHSKAMGCGSGSLMRQWIDSRLAGMGRRLFWARGLQTHEVSGRACSFLSPLMSLSSLLLPILTPVQTKFLHDSQFVLCKVQLKISQSSVWRKIRRDQRKYSITICCFFQKAVVVKMFCWGRFQLICVPLQTRCLEKQLTWKACGWCP